MGFMPKVPSNGSMYIKNGGFEYTGIKGEDPNQVMTFDPERGSVGPADLTGLMGGSCVSQYTENAPKERPRGGDLQIGDFWTKKSTKIISIWDGEKWKYVKTINGVITGTIIQSIYTTPLTPPPDGYLRCDGEPCPEEFTDLKNLLQLETGSINVPTLPAGFLIKT